MDTKLPDNPLFNKLYQKHCKLLKLHGFRPKTIDAYSRAIRRIGNYFGPGNIEHLSQDQLLEYFYQLLEKRSWSAVKLDLYGLRFFYTNILEKTWQDIPLIKPPKKTKRIPDIVTIKELEQIIAATHVLSYKVFFFTIYSMGLRLGEGINLTISDIDAQRMRVRIRKAKGNKDRLVPMPQNTLATLRYFWSLHQHPLYIFPNRKRGLQNAHLVDTPIERGGIQTAIRSVIKQIGLKKRSPAIPCGTATLPIYLKQVSICLSFRQFSAMSVC